jgi:hypothetical protein
MAKMIAPADQHDPKALFGPGQPYAVKDTYMIQPNNRVHGGNQSRLYLLPNMCLSPCCLIRLLNVSRMSSYPQASSSVDHIKYRT